MYFLQAMKCYLSHPRMQTCTRECESAFEYLKHDDDDEQRKVKIKSHFSYLIEKKKCYFFNFLCSLFKWWQEANKKLYKNKIIYSHEIIFSYVCSTWTLHTIILYSTVEDVIIAFFIQYIILYSFHDWKKFEQDLVGSVLAY